VAGIALLDLDGGEASGRTGLVVPHAQHLGHAAGVERTPDLRRAGDAFEQAGLVYRLVLGRAGQDRIIAVEDGLRVDVGPLLGVVGVVAHPFAERTFPLDLTQHGFALDRNLAIGRNGKAGIGPAHHVDRLATQAAGDVHLAHLLQRAR
jgi:hypothetical protein